MTCDVWMTEAGHYEFSMDSNVCELIESIHEVGEAKGWDDHTIARAVHLALEELYRGAVH
jgi:hypothetical protein